jgi:hypothetical protein
MLVKTQLAEFSFLVSVICAAGTALLFSSVWDALKAYSKTSVRYAVVASTAIAAIVLLISVLPKLQAKEKLLLDVRTSRIHANKAIKWIGANVPPDATVAVTGPSIFGISNEDQITSADDEYKAYAQHSFPQGFVRAYLHSLGRTDTHLAYLEDSTIAEQVLDSCRSVGNHFLFLQTEMDVDRFHGTIDGQYLLHQADSLCIRYEDGGFPSEVWKLKQ